MLRSLAAPAAWSTFVVIPAAGWGWLDGVPLGSLEAAALVLIWWAWAVGRHLPGARLVLVLASIKIVLAGLLVDRGFEARYYANDAWTPPLERSTEFLREPFTRRDDRLAFGTEGSPDLPLYFHNDVRFNFYRADEPRRDQLPYSVEWTGYVRGDPDAGDTTFYVDTGPGIWSELSLDGRPVLPASDTSRRSRTVGLENGWHVLTVRLRAPYGASRRIAAGEMVASTAVPFDGERVFLRPAGSARLIVDGALRWIARGADAVVLAWLMLLAAARVRLVWRDRLGVALLFLGALVGSLLLTCGYVGRMVVLSGGDDWLTYESFARAIALGDVIGAGQAGPFYYQPLYPYFVALTHVVFGDGLFGVVLLQRLLLVAAAAWAAVLTRHLFGTRAAWIALIGGGAFLFAKAARWTDVLLAEPLFTPLLVGWMALLVIISAETSRPRAAVAGAVGGIATLTRSTLLFGWPPILLLWWASLRTRRGRLLATLLVAMIAVVGLATLRNWMVANRLVLISTSFGVNLYLGNQPARPLDPAPPARVAVYDRLGVDPNLRSVAEFVIQSPGDFVRGLGNKALYATGFFGRSGLPGGLGTSRLYVGMWLLAAIGVARVLRPGCAPRAPAVWLPAAGALSHFAAVVLVFPHGYTDRLIVPLYPLLIPYAAYAVEPILPVGGQVIAWLRAVPRIMADGIRRHRLPAVLSILREPRNWTYLGYSAAVASSRAGVDLLTALLLPATALAVARLTRADRLHRVAGGVLWTAGLLHVAAAGSRAAAALHDPLFWGLTALVALGGSAAAGRWPRLAATLAGLAGGCTIAAILLPALPGFETTFPNLNVTTAGNSLAVLSRYFGPLGALGLLAVWMQGIAGGARTAGSGRILAATRGALLAALGLSLAGAVPGAAIDVRLWVAALGALLGLIEARARR